MNAEIDIFPDAEEMVSAYLASSLEQFGASIPITTSYPENRAGTPDTTFIRLAILGGNSDSLISETVVMDFEAWAPDDSSAIELMNLVRGIIRAMPDNILAVSFLEETMRPYRNPDPLSGQSRYTMQIRYGTCLTH